MPRFYLPLLCFFASFLICQVAAQEPSVPRQTSENKFVVKQAVPRLHAIDEKLSEFVESNECSGIVSLVGHKGKIVHLSAIGLCDVAASKQMQTHNLFAIASMTKPITATALMMLQEDGKLNVDDPISDYLPEFAKMQLGDGQAPNRPLTIRDAMTHTAGFTGSQTFTGSLADNASDIASRPLAFQPGEKWKYSPGLNVTGRIIEVVSGQTYQDFLQQRIFDPLGMKNSTFYPDATQKKRIAKLYAPGDKADNEPALVPVENHISNYSKERGPNPSGGLVASARDLFRFYQCILSDGQFRKTRILSKELTREMTSPKTGDLETGFTPGNCWGLGWCIVREPQGVTASLSSGTFGHGGAFGTQGWVDPETETIYVLMIQRTKFGNSDGSELRKAFHDVTTDVLGL